MANKTVEVRTLTKTNKMTLRASRGDFVVNFWRRNEEFFTALNVADVDIDDEKEKESEYEKELSDKNSDPNSTVGQVKSVFLSQLDW